MSIPSHILDQLNSQADLVGIIGKHTTLKRAGKEFKGNCPFHGEKTPSFYVNPQKNVYNCFGCGVGGNAISFLRDYENQTFMEAVQELSRQTGVEIPKEDNKNLRYKRAPKQSAPPPPQPPIKQPQDASTTSSSGNLNGNSVGFEPNNGSNTNNSSNVSGTNNFESAPVSDDSAGYFDEASYYNSAPPADWNSGFYPEDVAPFDPSMGSAPDYQSGSPYNQPQNSQQDSQEGDLYDLLVSVSEFYQHNLRNNSRAMAYFKERGLTDSTIEEFKLGYAPSGWQHLEQAFPRDIEGLKALGLVRNSEKGRDYDLLRDRVIFPIRDNQGRVIAFAGRALDNEVNPKYINSSDSPIFHKQHVLYGYYESRQHRANDWLVVEGYMDVIALYQAGIYGAVASMGTAINESQISRLLQLNPTLTLCFDGDSAGQKAAWRTLEVALPVLSDDKELRFLTLPGGHDPDTYVSLQGVEAMREQIKNAMPLSQYIFAYLSERYDLSLAEGKAKLMSQVRQLTNNLPKGSSFKYLLNNDIYQKLGGRKGQKSSAHDVLLDFDSDMTVSRMLELCLLFSPNLMQEDPIARIWQESGVADIELYPQRSKPKNEQAADANKASAKAPVTPPINVSTTRSPAKGAIKAPPLPSWQDFDSPSLVQLTETINTLAPHLPKDTNAAAHFILANLPANMQQTLAQRWFPFWSNLNKRGIIDVDELFDDLLVQLLLQALSKQMSQSKSIIITSYLNRQRQTLINWSKQQQAKQSNKMD
ncbi:DNA primase [Psychrobacter phenylpyruvicus]|uniref:DNA primase n=1 Tax=Psychrobacter phenylpyruvicus TaxID=29432 RepID=A0A379LIT0_9GAMM|nr:DNA primase [Psychrobacter phenylpyruvicus]SUD90486.1 DNA primase [Psychrobacter phenylpyruvicus]